MSFNFGWRSFPIQDGVGPSVDQIRESLSFFACVISRLLWILLDLSELTPNVLADEFRHFLVGEKMKAFDLISSYGRSAEGFVDGRKSDSGRLVFMDFKGWKIVLTSGVLLQ